METGFQNLIQFAHKMWFSSASVAKKEQEFDVHTNLVSSRVMKEN